MRLATFETRRAEEAGLERQAIVKMARRLNPEALDFDQTLTELENAVEVALDVIAKGERGTNLDAFVDAVLGLVGREDQNRRVRQRVARPFLTGGRSLSRIAVRVRMRAASWRVGENRIFSFFAQPKSGYGGVRFCGHCADNYSVIFLIVL